MNAVIYLWETISMLYIGAVMLRFLLQLVRADFYNPLSQFVVTITQPLLYPLRRVIPGYKGVDVAALVLMFVLQLIAVGVIFAMKFPHPPWHLLAPAALAKLVSLLLSLYFMLLIAQVILSWVAQGYHPIVSLLHSLTDPILRPIRGILPQTGGIDFSPLIAIIGIGFFRILLGDLFPAFRNLF